MVPGAMLQELSLETMGQQRARAISGTEKNEADIAAAGQSPPQKLRLKAEQSSAEDSEPRLLFLNSATAMLCETMSKKK